MEHYDDLETRSADAREAALLAALPRQIAHAKAKAPGFARILAEVEPAEVTGRQALARLPIIHKSELVDLQADSPPFGDLTALPPDGFARIFVSPGPIYEPQAPRSDPWRLARALHAAGFRAGEIVHNCFSYHLTPGGWMLDAGARALGCTVFPGGIGNGEHQARAMADLRPGGYTGSPDFLKVLLDKAEELGLDVSCLKKALVSGGALFPSLRQHYEARGIKTFQAYAIADLGLVAYETAGPDGTLCEGLVVDEQLIVEIVRPGTGDPVADGEVGEVVVNTLDSDYPLIRFATGDLSKVLPGAGACGRTNVRLAGWMGRADQATKVKGAFVQPSQVAKVVAFHPEIIKARLVVERRDETDVMTLRCEVERDRDGLSSAICLAIQEVCKLKGEVALVPPGALPNDGKVIEDLRSYE
jgi:phenylacetate-CoA ligase